jgi:hypothetical protein
MNAEDLIMMTNERASDAITTVEYTGQPAKRPRLDDGEIFDHRGYRFRVTFPRDDTYRSAPWDEYDGNGIISDWRPKDSKRPGERILTSDRSSCRFYDWQATIERAKREQWGPRHCAICGEESGGVGSEAYGTIHATPGIRDHEYKHEPAGKTAARAVQRDFDRWAAWCRDEWEYVGVVVQLVDEDDEDDESQPAVSLWDIESDSREYLTETAYEHADEIIRLLEVDQPDIVPSEN